ncbi:GPI mannosyltransferase 4-like [Asterias amurensis]|uniref:GPI mannosyltransferase 4-like n=1 Tax=Asterias amurensis TaxID=7602 RepID=UPI003AB90601
MGYKVWIALVCIRIVLCLWPMTGYIHPDEFFQNTEPLAGDIFGFDVLRTWEFNSSRPVRSIFFPHITTGLGYKILQYLDSVGIVSVSSYTLLVFPRVIMALVSLLCIDYPVYMICQLLRIQADICLTVLASSYVSLTYHTRTFSNSYETMVFVLLLLLVVDSRLDQFKPPETQPESKKKHQTKPSVNKVATRPNHGFWIGVFVVEGTFNRITFPCYFLIPLIFWLTGSSTEFGVKAVREVVRNVIALLPGCLTMLISNLVMDSVYFGSLDATILTKPHILYSNLNYDFLSNNITVTPLNSLLYHLDSSNIAQHGLHPRITHIIANLPILYLPLVICFVSELLSLVSGTRQTQSTGFTGSSSRAFFALCFVTPVFLLSMVPHQEPRFIIPVLVPLVLLYAEFVMMSTSLPNIPWIIWNLLGCIIFGFIHQGGIVPSIAHTHSLTSQPVQNLPIHYHFVFYHTYMPPRHLALINQSMSTVFIDDQHPETNLLKLPNIMTYHDLMGSSSLTLSTTVEKLLCTKRTPTPQYYQKQVYVFAPASLDATFCRLGIKQNYKLVKTFFPHISTEDIPELMPSYTCVAEPERSYQYKTGLQTLKAVFSLNMYRADVVRMIAS